MGCEVVDGGGSEKGKKGKRENGWRKGRGPEKRKRGREREKREDEDSR
jgi:hypothetical protein